MSTMCSDSPDTPNKSARPYLPRADIRYRVPVIAVEPEGNAFVSRDWSRSGFVLPGERLSEIGSAGSSFSGSFTIAGYPGFGLFDAVIERIDSTDGSIVTRFAEISAHGLRLLETAERERRKGDAIRPGVLTIRLAYATHDWSASALAISEDRGRFQRGQQIRGKIRVDRTQAVLPFSGLVLRVSRDAEIVAIKLLHFGAGAQTLLNAILHADPIDATDASLMVLGVV
jgi:hypothetical protein